MTSNDLNLYFDPADLHKLVDDSDVVYVKFVFPAGTSFDSENFSEEISGTGYGLDSKQDVKTQASVRICPRPCGT